MARLEIERARERERERERDRERERERESVRIVCAACGWVQVLLVAVFSHLARLVSAL